MSAPKTLEIENPEGVKKISLDIPGEVLTVTLTDYEAVSRDFELHIELNAPNTECLVEGRAQSTQSAEKQWKVFLTLNGESQLGEIDFRGTSEDDGYLAFEGGALLSPTSKKGSVNIEEKMILFDNAKGQLFPILNVETDDVESASHGAGIAPVDREQINYLLSRGINRHDAEQLIKDGFLGLLNASEESEVAV